MRRTRQAQRHLPCASSDMHGRKEPSGPSAWGFVLGPVGDVHGHVLPSVERRAAIPVLPGDHDASTDYHVRPDTVRRVFLVHKAGTPCRGDARTHRGTEPVEGFGRKKPRRVDGHLERFENEDVPGGDAAAPTSLVVEAAPPHTVEIPVTGRDLASPMVGIAGHAGIAVPVGRSRRRRVVGSPRGTWA